MVKRTQNEIARDYVSIRKAADSSKSFKDIERITGLKYNEIITSLKKHPRVYEKIKKRFEQEQKNNKPVKHKESKKLDVLNIVIDTSVTGIADIENILREEKGRIILTQIVIKELSHMQHFEDSEAMRARHILAMPADNEDKFIHELISEEYETADKCILEYCLKNKEDVILYTADKEMFNFAKVYKIPVKLFRALPKVENGSKRSITFKGLERVGMDLIIDLDRCNSSFKMVRLISNGIEYDKGIIKLKVGDDIFLASKRLEGYVSFAHYKITSLWENNHCDLISSKRLYDLKDPDVSYKYKPFIREFKRRIA